MVLDLTQGLVEWGTAQCLHEFPEDEMTLSDDPASSPQHDTSHGSMGCRISIQGLLGLLLEIIQTLHEDLWVYIDF